MLLYVGDGKRDIGCSQVMALPCFRYSLGMRALSLLSLLQEAREYTSKNISGNVKKIETLLDPANFRALENSHRGVFAFLRSILKLIEYTSSILRRALCLPTAARTF